MLDKATSCTHFPVISCWNGVDLPHVEIWTSETKRISFSFQFFFPRLYTCVAGDQFTLASSLPHVWFIYASSMPSESLIK